MGNSKQIADDITRNFRIKCHQIFDGSCDRQKNKREPFSIPNADDLLPIYSNSEAGCKQREPRSPIKFILHTLYATKSSKALLTQLKKKET